MIFYSDNYPNILYYLYKTNVTVYSIQQNQNIYM